MSDVWTNVEERRAAQGMIMWDGEEDGWKKIKSEGIRER